MNHWLDVDKIDYWFCVDDNSSDEERDKMRNLYQGMDFYMKTPSEKGHRQSMNIIWNKLEELKSTYWIHMEDDFLFHKKMNYVTDALNGLTGNVKQILFNRNYGEIIEHYDAMGHISSANENIVLHEHKIGAFPYSNHHYWRHYSFRPSLIDVKTILDLGNYDSENQFFEMDYAKRWEEAGHKSGFLNFITNRHIGRLTSERNTKTVKNAYELNEEEQFSNPLHPLHPLRPLRPRIKIINLLRRPDRKESARKIMESENIIPPHYEYIEAVDGKTLDAAPYIVELFTGNDFGSRRGVIGCALSHYNLWKKLLHDPENKYYIIMEDDFSLCSNFKTHLESMNSEFLEKDIVFLGYHMFSSKREKVIDLYNSNKAPTISRLNKDLYIGGTHCYSINKTGAEKLLKYVEKSGIKHGIDYVMKIVPELHCYESQPHLAFAEWNEGGKIIDTDIQNKNHESDILF